MELNGNIQPAPTGARGFDSDTIVSPSVALQFFQQGYSFCIRYISLGSGQNSGDLSSSEASDILQAGLALMVVQHVSEPGWQPSQSSGQNYGTNAGSNAVSIGLPPGVNVWCDLEGISADTDPQNVIEYCEAWYSAVYTSGYVPGLYVGANAVFNNCMIFLSSITGSPVVRCLLYLYEGIKCYKRLSLSSLMASVSTMIRLRQTFLAGRYNG